MTSVVDVCNMALTHIRAGTINSLDESSVQAKQCKLFYPILRDQMLQDSPWQFATAVKPLSLLVHDLHQWAFTYQYPSDCLFINAVRPDLTAVTVDTRAQYSYTREIDHRDPAKITVPYEVQNLDGVKVIGTNYPNVRIDYRVKIEDPNLFSNNFTLALSHLLASTIAVSIIGVDKGAPMSNAMMQRYSYYLSAGVANELNEQEDDIPESDYITVRN